MGGATKRAVETLRWGPPEALTYLHCPGLHHRFIKATNMSERLFRELKRRSRVEGVFINERSALNLVPAVVLRKTDDRTLTRYLSRHEPSQEAATRHQDLTLRTANRTIVRLKHIRHG